MRILILEDDLSRMVHFKKALLKHIVDHTEDSKAAIELLKEHNYDTLFLDHDLGGKQLVASGEGTGYEVAEWLSKNDSRKPRQIYLHSLNGPGRKNMKSVLPEAVEAPFAWLHIMDA